jgi:hypothetical protein
LSDGKIVVSVNGSAARKLFEALRKYEADTPHLTEIKRA